MAKKDWDRRYIAGDLPWDTGRPDETLKNIVRKFKLKGNSLEIGCGRGTDSIWLAKQGLKAVAYDISSAAIVQAKARLTKGLKVDFRVGNFLNESVKGKKFDLIYDRGCFHSINGNAGKKNFAKRVHSLLKDRGIWLSLIGSCDDGPRDHGPPQMSVREISALLEPDFRFLSLESVYFNRRQNIPALAWACVMGKRIS